MNTVTIPESEFLQLQTEVLELKKRLLALEAAAVSWVKSGKKKPLATAPKTRSAAKKNHPNGAKKLGKTDLPEEPIPAVSGITVERIPLKRGAGKHIITFMADDFTAPLEDMKAYMQ